MKRLISVACLTIALVSIVQADRDRTALAERDADIAALKEVRKCRPPDIEPEQSQSFKREKAFHERISELEMRLGIVHETTPNPLTMPPKELP